MEIKTNFLAEDWLEVLEKQVKPIFPEMDFVVYQPEAKVEGAINSPKISIVFSEKTAFLYKLRGAEVDDRTVIDSLKRYVFKVTKKKMTEK
jgi:hypothetical protein